MFLTKLIQSRFMVRRVFRFVGETVKRNQVRGITKQRPLQILALCIAVETLSPAQTFKTLVNFDGKNGANPFSSLVETTDGTLYGTTSGAFAQRSGTIFEMTPDGNAKTSYRFCSKPDCTDGKYPFGAMVQDRDGNLYGTTSEGGAVPYGGTVFKFSPKEAKLTTLYNFCSKASCADGQDPYFGLVRGEDRNFYGTTGGGGQHGEGTVFLITPTGDLTTLYSFCSQPYCVDGEYPSALFQGSDGIFYGTTAHGGANGYGTVFRITPSGNFAVIYSFCAQANCVDGSIPYSGVVQAADGNFFGTTVSGGAAGLGTVFRLTPHGRLTVLYSFCSEKYCVDGEVPVTLVQDKDGAFYGTTAWGGANVYGTVFRITARGKLTRLHSFDSTDGENPYGPLIQTTNGDFYGTTVQGGSGIQGTVYRFSRGTDPSHR